MPPPKPNPVLRIGIPLALTVVAVGVAFAVFTNTTAPSTPASNPQAAPAQAGQSQTDSSVPSNEADEAADRSTTTVANADDVADPVTASSSQATPQTEAETQPETAAAQAEETEPAADQAPAAQLRARITAAAAPVPAPIGGIDPDGSDALRIEFSTRGAGVASLRLASEFQDVSDRTKWATDGTLEVDDHVEIQAQQSTGSEFVTPFAALWVEIDRSVVWLIDAGVWTERSPGTFEAIIEDDAGEAQLRITRSFVLEPDSLDVLVSQRIENLTETPRRVRLVTFGPTDLPKGDVTYGGDRRRIRFGYLLRPELDPARTNVLAEKFLSPRNKFLGERDDITRRYAPVRQVWPTGETEQDQLTLVWAGMTNRYYSVVVHDQALEGTTSRAIRSIETVDRVVLEGAADPKLILRLGSPTIDLGPSAVSTAASYRFYAGPKHEPTIADNPRAADAGIEGIVAYNFGGPCAFCTFTWLTGPLLGALRFFEGIVTDWSVAIVMLVLCVRTILHPVNRWSQIRVQRFGKQMQDLAPKQKKIQEKFKDDRQAMQQEMAKLWREEGVNPAGMLGCLPMLLQSPIWIALYASLFYFFDLRHEPAFYGVVQTITGGSWLFLADMAEPDGFIPLPASWHFSIPLMGQIQSFNVLPILLAIVYFVHMKFMTPPTSATLTPEQEQTQKIAKYMTVGLFPIIMYNAPSGLALYFITNSTVAILENTWIRSHIKKHDLLEVTKKPKKPGKPRKKGGFLERLQQIAEQQQQLRQQQLQQRQQGGTPGRPGKTESKAQQAIRKSRGG